MEFYKPRALAPLCCVLVVAVFGLTGCERATTKASDERLGGLLADGLDAKVEDRATKRLQGALGRDNAVGALANDFATINASSGSLQLQALLASTLERNTRIGAAAQQINRADAERLNAIFGYLPQINVTYGHDQLMQEVVATDNAVFELGEAKYPVTTIQARIDQPIIDLSRIFGIQHASNARSLAEVEYIRVVRDVVYEVFDAYLVASQARTRAASLRQRMGFWVVKLTAKMRSMIAVLGT